MANKREFSQLFKKAHEAGMSAGNACRPTPMVVGSPSTPFGNDVDLKQEHWVVADGVCGFAWISVRPGTSSFARWLVATDKGRKAYEGGIQIWVKEFGQSMARKSAYARAFAQVLQDADINAYAGSRMD